VERDKPKKIIGIGWTNFAAVASLPVNGLRFSFYAFVFLLIIKIGNLDQLFSMGINPK
jgi:hypothetical protein